MNSNFWAGKRVFLTGHTGFKGSWLSLWLQQLGVSVTGYALPPPTDPSFFNLARIEDGMHSIIGDVRDREALSMALKLAAPDIVIHMAAQPLVRQGYKNPVETYETNIMGTVNLLEAVRHANGIRAVINVTTDKCYENREWDWGYRENEAMGGFDPYSSSKGCSELVTASYRSSFFNPNEYSEHGLAVASARAGNVIGGGDWAENRLIPDILAAFESDKHVQIRHPHANRPWQYVLEPLRGYLTLAERLYEQGASFAEGWNFGPNDQDCRSVGWIVQRMAELWGDQAKWSLDASEKPHEATHLKLDTSKARNRLGWKPALCLDETLNLIVDWSKKRLAGANIRTVSLSHIKSYQTLNQS